MAECQAVEERKQLTAQLEIAAEPHVGGEDFVDKAGTEEELMRAFGVLSGIVAEYKDGGDQMVENCTCGRHIPPELAENIRDERMAPEHPGG